MIFNNVENTINLPALSSPPLVKDTGDMYLDDGTNTTSGLVGFRRWDGSSWVDVSAIPANVTIFNSVDDLPTPSDLSDGLGEAYRLSSGYYYFGNDMSLAYPIAPAIDGADVAFTTNYNNTITYTGSGAFFRANTTTAFFGLAILECILLGDGSNTLFSIDGDASQNITLYFNILSNFNTLGTIDNQAQINVDQNLLVGFTVGLAIDNCAYVAVRSTELAPASALNGSCIEVDGSVATHTFNLTGTKINLLNANHEAFDIKASYAGFVSIDNSLVDTSLGGVAFSSGSKDQTIIKITSHKTRGIPDSQIIGSFYIERNTNDTAITNTGETGAFTSVADAGGGEVTITSASHGLNNGDVTWIIDDDYTGMYTISGVTTDTFNIVAPWTETTTGTWETHWVKIEGTTLALENERASMTGDNELTFTNVEEQTSVVSVTINASNDTVAAAKNWEFAVMKNGARLKGALITRQMSTILVNSMAISSVGVCAGDVFGVYVRNLSDTTDCIVANMTLIVRGA